MSKLEMKHNRTIRSEQVLNAFVQIVRSNLPLDLKKTRITADDILYALAYANVHRLSIESACLELAGAPSGNRLREVLVQALPERSKLQRALNRMFRQQLHPSLLKGKTSFNIAIDLTLIPYHEQPYRDEKEIVRGESTSGTTHFHGYATVSIVRDNRRYVVALRFVEYGEEMAVLVRWLIKRLKALKLRLRRAFLDKGFCSQPVFKVLNQHHLSYVIPIPLRGKSGGVRRLFQGQSCTTTYTFHSPKYGEYTVQAVVVQRYSKGRSGRHARRWLAFAVSGLPTCMLPAQVFELYRQRFGIETSYRQMNLIRARTSTRNPVIPLLLIGLAFVIFNLYITLRQIAASAPKSSPPASKCFWLSLSAVWVSYFPELLSCNRTSLKCCNFNLVLCFRDLLIIDVFRNFSIDLGKATVTAQAYFPGLLPGNSAYGFGLGSRVLLNVAESGLPGFPGLLPKI